MLIDKEIQITWQSRNKNHYVDKGYIFTKVNDPLIVKVEDLPHGSHVKVKIRCDKCGKELLRFYNEYIKFHDDEFGDLCNACSKVKRKATNLRKYGSEWYTQVDKFQEQRAETMTEKYGHPHTLQNEELREKFKQTCKKNNGTEYPMQSFDVKEKRKETYLKNYGYEYSLQSPVVRKKIEETCMKKYGTTNTAVVPEFIEIRRQSLFENGTIASSKPERKTVELLKELYGEENCIPQYPTKYYNLDCLVLINGIKIDVEYDGAWFHSQNTSFDNRRDKYHINHGYKVLRIKGGSKVPTKEQIDGAIHYLLEQDENYTEIILNT